MILLRRLIISFPVFTMFFFKKKNLLWDITISFIIIKILKNIQSHIYQYIVIIPFFFQIVLFR